MHHPGGQRRGAVLVLLALLAGLMIGPVIARTGRPQALAGSPAWQGLLAQVAQAQQGTVVVAEMPRTDLDVTVRGVPVEPSMVAGFVAIEQFETDSLVVGELALLDQEIDPVVSQLQQQGFTVTALVCHQVQVAPSLTFVHFTQRGQAQQLIVVLIEVLRVSRVPVAPLQRITPAAPPVQAASPTPARTDTPSPSPTGTVSETPAETATATETPEETATATETPAETATASETPAETATATETPEETATATETPAETATASETPEEMATATRTPTRTPTRAVTRITMPTPRETAESPTLAATPATPEGLPTATSMFQFRLGLPRGRVEQQGGDLDTEQIEAILGQTGRTLPDGVFEVSIPRNDAISVAGVQVAPEMGVQTVIRFQSLGDGQAAVIAEMALLGGEVNPVVNTLQANGIAVSAIQNHFLDESPRLFFVNTWATGDAVTLARALRSALDLTNSAGGG